MEMISVLLLNRTGMKRLLLLLLIATLSLPARAQQDPMYSMYMFNMMAINPAYAGSSDHLVATGLFRRQWMDFPGAPQTATFTVHSPLRSEKVGLGLSLFNDRLGDMNTNGIMGAYSYHLRFTNSVLALGLQAGMRNFSINLTELKLSPSGQYDDAFSHNISQWDVNFGAGAFWYSDKFYFGFSVPHISNTILSDQQLNTTYVARLRTHANVAGGYVFKVAPQLRLKPSFMAKYVGGAPVQLDINANLYWMELFGIGVSYRTFGTLVYLAEIQLNKNLRIGYAYDQYVNNLRGYAGGSHEFMLRFDMGFDKNRTLTPRYF